MLLRLRELRLLHGCLLNYTLPPFFSPSRIIIVGVHCPTANMYQLLHERCWSLLAHSQLCQCKLILTGMSEVCKWIWLYKGVWAARHHESFSSHWNRFKFMFCSEASSHSLLQHFICGAAIFQATLQDQITEFVIFPLVINFLKCNIYLRNDVLKKSACSMEICCLNVSFLG